MSSTNNQNFLYHIKVRASHCECVPLQATGNHSRPGCDTESSATEHTAITALGIHQSLWAC